MNTISNFCPCTSLPSPGHNHQKGAFNTFKQLGNFVEFGTDYKKNRFTPFELQLIVTRNSIKGSLIKTRKIFAPIQNNFFYF